MKFGALLRTSAEDVPELQNLFLCYKQLKKKLKRLPARTTTGGVDQGMTAEERSFVQTLNADVLQFNDLFIEKEEESVIKLGDLEEQAGAASTSEEIAKVQGRSNHATACLHLMDGHTFRMDNEISGTLHCNPFQPESAGKALNWGSR